MIAAIVAQLFQLSFSPPLVFPGEKFSIHAPPGVILKDPANVVLWRSNGKVVSPAPAAFTAIYTRNGEPVDAVRVMVPVVLAPAWYSWPRTSTVSGGCAFLITKAAKLALVPTEIGYGLITESAGRALRYPNVLSITAAARESPMRGRALTANYLYAGSKFVTLLARPAGIARLAVTFSVSQITATLFADYDIKGSLTLGAQEMRFDLKAGQRQTFQAGLP